MSPLLAFIFLFIFLYSPFLLQYSKFSLMFIYPVWKLGFIICLLLKDIFISRKISAMIPSYIVSLTFSPFPSSNTLRKPKWECFNLLSMFCNCPLMPFLSVFLCYILGNCFMFMLQYSSLFP